ncbi:MAG: substrate-binding domain-containing protein [Verrucomicrobiales bacterium]|jgi:LacI family transcriptional regulator|nr:substrate-binding domain-containing protein [Verrucomicrobiales bacterium]
MTKPRHRVLLVQAWWSKRILEGVAKYASEHNWTLDCEMGWTHHLPARWHGDGIIVYADTDRAIINYVKKKHVPVVDCSTFNDSFGARKAIIDNEAITRLAVNHLRGLGFANFGCVLAADHPIDHLRCALYEKMVAANGDHFKLLHLKQLAKILPTLPRPMGLLTTNDRYAIETIRACQDAGFSVPDDFAVVGIDNTPILCDLTAIPVTSVDPNFIENGYQCAALLDRLMRGEKTSRAPVIIPPKGITLRRSTDTLFIPNPDATRALQYLRHHYLRPISVTQATVGTTAPLRNIQKIFRQYTGRTMVQELTRLRIEHAKKLLQNPKEKIDTIARACSFSSRTYFIRAFRRYAGMSPKAYRKQTLTVKE